MNKILYILSFALLIGCSSGSENNINESKFLALFSGKVYELGEGENVLIVSFDLENYSQNCGDINQVGWVGSYWADGPTFAVDVNYRDKELTTHTIVNCKAESKKTYLIKYIDQNKFSLTLINCEGGDSFFDQGCGPYILTCKN